MSNLTREEQHARDLAAVNQDGYALEYVKVQTEAICLAAVNQAGYALDYVKVQTEAICLAAVNQTGYALGDVEVQTEEICLAAVKQKGYALGDVDVQTEEICLAAVKQNGHALQYVHEQTEAICLAAVKQNGNALRYVKVQTEAICLAAVNQDGSALYYVEGQFLEVCKYFLEGSNTAPVNTTPPLSYTPYEVFESSVGPFSLSSEGKSVELGIQTDCNYKHPVSPSDAFNGYVDIKIDPTFVSSQWQLGHKDPSCMVYQLLQTISGFGTKNTVETEIQALHAQITRMAEIYKVKVG